MKKITKLLVLVMSLALIIGISAVVAFADGVTDPATPSTVAADGNLFKVVYGSTEKYYDSSAKLSTVISEATAGSTIYLLRDYTEVTDRYENPSKAGEYIATSIKVNKKLTFDLGGHTLTVEQHAKNCGFYISTTSPVVFKNGTVATVAHADYNTAGNTFPFAFINAKGANLAFENVNSNVSSIVYSWGNNYTVTVNGGIHFLNSASSDMNTSGFIAGQNNTNATITNATIYSYGRYVVGSSSYKAVEGGLTPSSTFKFENCNIIASSASTSIVGNANQ